MSRESLFNHPFLGRGFRPFFLLGAGYAAFSVLVWAGGYAGLWGMPDVLQDPVLWHAHEMIYGVTVAIVSGFLLTAVANWTGGAPARQAHLAALCLVWLAGRIVMYLPEIPFGILVVVEGAYLPALALTLSIPLLKSWNVRNFAFLGVLAVLFVCDVAFLVTESREFLHAAIMLILCMISLIGGRVIPSFTVAALRRRGLAVAPRDQYGLDQAALAALAVTAVLTMVTGISGPLVGLAALAASAMHLVRMRFYHSRLTLVDPMLWILHIGHLWMGVGLALVAGAAFELLPVSIALHALTAGAIGTMCIGMMCRVSLGHTGRDIVAGRGTVTLFLLAEGAALTRVLGPLAMPDLALVWVVISGLLWAACFAGFVVLYAPILWKARPDGLSA